MRADRDRLAVRCDILRDRRDRLAAECDILRDRRDQLVTTDFVSKRLRAVVDDVAGGIRPADFRAPVALLYLARRAEGVDAFRRFATAYRRYAPGIEHNLIVIYKAFDDATDLTIAEARQVFADIPHTAMIVPDIGFDLGSYALVARAIHSPFVCCLNTYSEPLCDGWLGKLYRHAARPEVGVAGASCSYESVSSSFIILNKALHYENTFPRHGNPSVDDYFGFLWKKAAPKSAWWNAMGKWARGVLPPPRRRSPPRLDWDAWLESWLKTETGPLGYLLTFPRFPNPHVRSNAFMMGRERLLWWIDPLPVTKYDCAAMESGPDSLTRRLSRKNLAAVGVGCDGEQYPIERYPESGVFRIGEQTNLLVADNRTREFIAMSPKVRTLYKRMSWGDYLLPEPDDFPPFASPFPKNLAATRGVAPVNEPALAFDRCHLKERERCESFANS